jgi:gamma-glutamylcyclotransferase (GGCT)/AIG2-like uncharacterized protein YtfP
MLYFAYGSNMHPGQMRNRCPGCTFVVAARLRDHRLVFSRPFAAWDGGGVADIQPAVGSIVEGVVWDISPAHRDALDAYEEYPTAYTRKDVVVETSEGQTLAAFAYCARPLGSYRPGRRYLNQLIEGARANGLSPMYVAFLESIGASTGSQGPETSRE